MFWCPYRLSCIYIYCVFAGLDNKLHEINGTYIKTSSSFVSYFVRTQNQYTPLALKVNNLLKLPNKNAIHVNFIITVFCHPLQVAGSWGTASSPGSQSADTAFHFVTRFRLQNTEIPKKSLAYLLITNKSYRLPISFYSLIMQLGSRFMVQILLICNLDSQGENRESLMITSILYKVMRKLNLIRKWRKY